LKQGWFGLRNRLPVERNTSNQERDSKEADFFSRGLWADLDPGKLGIKHLRTALIKMLNTHITNSIPELIPEIKQRLSSRDHALAQLGRPRSSKSEQIECMVTLSSLFSRASEDALNGYYQNLPDEDSAKLRKIVQDRLEAYRDSMQEDYQDSLPLPDATVLRSTAKSTWRSSILAEENLAHIYEVIHANRGIEFPDEVNHNVMGILWRSQTQQWNKLASDLIVDLGFSIAKTMTLLVGEATAEQELQANTTSWLLSQIPTTTAAAIDELSKLLVGEARTWTLVPKYSELMGELYKGHIKNMARSLCALDDRSDTAALWENKIDVWLAHNKDVDSVLNTYFRLKAYYEVAMERFIDNVALQVVERHLLGPSSVLRSFTPSYIVKMAEEDAELLRRIAGENGDKVLERAAIASEITSLTEALASAGRFGLSNN
jgi:hypothetical protein